MIFKKTESILNLVQQNKFTYNGNPFVCLVNNLWSCDTHHHIQIVQGYTASEYYHYYDYIFVVTFGLPKYYLTTPRLHVAMLQKI